MIPNFDALKAAYEVDGDLDKILIAAYQKGVENASLLRADARVKAAEDRLVDAAHAYYTVRNRFVDRFRALGPAIVALLEQHQKEDGRLLAECDREVKKR